MKRIFKGLEYYATEDGSIVSNVFKKERTMKQHIRGDGYYHVSLTVDEYKTKNYSVHKLVATAYHGESKGREVRHLDGNKLNCNKDNLKYGTISENQMDRVRHGTSNRGEQHGMVELTEEKVIEIRSKHVKGKYGYKRLGKEYSVSPSTIQNIIERTTWKHI